MRYCGHFIVCVLLSEIEATCDRIKLWAMANRIRYRMAHPHWDIDDVFEEAVLKRISKKLIQVAK